jgi:uracil-DNA glycosylase family 4
LTTDQDEALAAIAKEVRGCTKCPLWESRINAVPGEGPATAEVMIVGEAPGRTEDLHGRPFVGSAGRNLDAFLREARIERQRAVFITNTVKCRPPSNRRPNRKEVETCYQYLRRQIKAISPKVILLLGDVALKEFFPDSSLSQVHGKVLKKNDKTVSSSRFFSFFFPTYHPAAVIYNPALKETMLEDFRVLGRELGRRDDPV